MERLTAGPVESKIVLAEAKAAGISRSNIYRAAEELDVRKEVEPPHGFGAGRSSLWSLPSHMSKKRPPSLERMGKSTT